MIFFQNSSVLCLIEQVSIKTFGVELNSTKKDLLNSQDLHYLFRNAHFLLGQALLRALGIIYYKITGPYWSLIQSETQYVDFYIYVQRFF